MRTEFFPAGVKAQRDESEGRVLMGDNIGRREVKLRPIRFQCAVVWIIAALACIDTLAVYSGPTCAKFNLHWTFRQVSNTLIR
jgi:hypothetical protein